MVYVRGVKITKHLCYYPPANNRIGGNGGTIAMIINVAFHNNYLKHYDKHMKTCVKRIHAHSKDGLSQPLMMMMMMMMQKLLLY